MTIDERIERSEALGKLLNYIPTKGNLDKMNQVLMNLSITEEFLGIFVDKLKEVEVKIDNIEKDIFDIKGLLTKILEKVDK